jgi:nucleotide-binding universal stress UspA family protein
MTSVIAALDNSLAARPVIATALALGRLLDAEPELIHVAVDGDRIARSAAEAAGLPLETVPGAVVEQLLERGRADGVAAMVVGARATPGGRKPLGSTALAIATTLQKPVVIVPPHARPRETLRRILVPLEGDVSATLLPRAIFELGCEAKLEVIVLHVLEETTLPTFTDQPQHESQEWAREFLKRYSPWGIDQVRLELRVGNSEELIPLVADQTDVDLIALGWAQELAPDRARVVRATLARSNTPVMLVPVLIPSRSGLRPTEEESWNSLPSLPA